jgi:hypothetical protein
MASTSLSKFVVGDLKFVIASPLKPGAQSLREIASHKSPNTTFKEFHD